MNYKQLLNLVLRNYPGRKDNRLEQMAKDAIRGRQLEAAEMKFEGWPFLKREALINFDGGYATGQVTCTQDSTTVTLADGTWPSNVVGWILAPQSASTERYTVKTRDSDTQVTLDRPYLGDTVTTGYAVYDRRGTLPLDYYQGESVVAEASGGKLGTVSLAYARAGTAKSVALGDAKFTFLTERTKTAAYDTGTVTIAKNSATVTLATGTWPTWSKHHFLRFGNEPMWYRILTRDSDTQVTLDRTYGGNNAGAGVSYQLDPPGSYQVEYEFPREDQFALRIVYYMIPEELVNTTDEMEGPEGYQRAVCDLAAADVLASLPPEEFERLQPLYQQLMQRGSVGLEALLRGRPEPNMEAVVHDIRHRGKTYWG
jgi:hypothetical protein